MESLQISKKSKNEKEGTRKIPASHETIQEYRLFRQNHENEHFMQGLNFFGRDVVFLDRRIEKLSALPKPVPYSVEKEDIKVSAIKNEKENRQKLLKNHRDFLIKNVFNASTENKLKKLQEAFISPALYNDGDIIQKNKVREKLFKIAKIKPDLSGEYKRSLMVSLAAIIEDPVSTEQYKNYAKSIADAIIEYPNKLSIELVNEIIYQRMDYFNKSIEFLNKNSGKLKDDCVEKIIRLAHDYDITVSPESIKSNIDGVALKPLDIFQSLLDSKLGTYSIESHTAKVAIGGSGNLLHTVDHELVHALSGSVFDNREDYVVPVKNGLGFLNPKTEKRFLRWMNEGVTEKITAEMNKGSEESYQNECEMIDLIMYQSGGAIRKKDLYDAFFEELTDTEGKRHGAWRKLSSAIKEKYGAGFLRTVDELYKKHGSAEALAYVKMATKKNNK